MWKRLHFVLAAIRLYLCLQPSYIHPDEHFQGPEIIASEVFGWPAYKTWEFTSLTPVRSVFPLWLVYGIPLTVLKWIWDGLGYGEVPPIAVFYTLRSLMFILSFVLEDWAIHDLAPSARERRLVVSIVASSYVTWTFQTHTFSNALETLLVLWCIVLMERIRACETSTMTSTCIALSFLAILGVFNRITFPAFLLVPAIQLVPHLFKRTLRLPVLLLSGLLFLAIGITMDTEYYTGSRPHLRDLWRGAVFTPWNNLAYNFDTANLAKHGLHPFWQHFAINLPQLIGPAFPLLVFSSNHSNIFWTAALGVAILSCFRHQEPRFLLPAIPLFLTSLRIPLASARRWIISWVIFNIAAGVLFGVYHQGGIVPAQTWLKSQSVAADVFWWKTYSPPRWLLDGSNGRINTIDLMGMPGEEMLAIITEADKLANQEKKVLLVAPASANFLDLYTSPNDKNSCWKLEELWRYHRHIGLDDLDFGEDGVWPTLNRVIGRRGLVIWEASNNCQ